MADRFNLLLAEQALLRIRELEASLDARIARVAGAQHGVIARFQLRLLGAGKGAIEDRVRRQQLHHIDRAVFAVGHRALTRESRWMAGVLSVGTDAVLSGVPCLDHWGLRRGRPSRREVTVPRRLPSRPGLKIRYSLLPGDEVTAHDGIPLTVPSRAVLDAAVSLRPHILERAINEIEVQRLWVGPSLREILERYPRRPGTPAIRRLIKALIDGGEVTRSNIEALLKRLVLESPLPRPRFNHRVLLPDGTPRELDVAWPRHRVAIELDHRGVHDTALRFESDRARIRKLATAGWQVLPVTDDQVRSAWPDVLADTRALLAQRHFKEMPGKQA